ncbi:hypothetical protein [Novosphingobium panipatense]|uniref:hypothetical protein n=1 Tax=Novosphingobium panipatense TaxID=428991 RepID=UPI000A39DEAE
MPTAPRRRGATIPPALRKTLLDWIETDDGDTAGFTPPACSAQARALHARIVDDKPGGAGEFREPLQPPTGLRLPPLG